MKLRFRVLLACFLISMPGIASPIGDDLPTAVVYPAVTLAIAKKTGENAIDITTAIEARLGELINHILPPGIEVVVTRDYGKTQTLIRDLVSATLAVMLLVLAAMGWRQALIVGTAVLITLLLTLVPPGRGRGRHAHHHGQPHHYGGAHSHGLRHGPDGALHAPYPHQRLRRHGSSLSWWPSWWRPGLPCVCLPKRETRKSGMRRARIQRRKVTR